MMMRRMIFFGLLIMRTVSSSISSESESLLTCSKFHFEERVLEKLVRLEHKVEIYEETIKKWEHLFVSKLEKLDEVQKQSETFFKSMQVAQVQEEIRLHKSYNEIIDGFKSQIKNETEFYEDQMNNLFESGSMKIKNKFQSFERKTRSVINNQTKLYHKFFNNIWINVTNLFQNMETKQNATNVKVLNALSEIETFDSKYAEEGVKITTLQGRFNEESAKIKTLERHVADNNKKGYDELILKRARQIVAFTAYRSSSQQLSHRTKVLFDKVWNNIGNGYDTTSGIFTAPHAGIYHFGAVILSQAGKNFYLILYHNDVMTSGSWVTGDGFKTGSFDVVLSLQSEDTVYIAGSSVSSIYSDGGISITFSGHNIF